MASRLEKACGVDTRTNTGIGSDLKGCIKLRLSVMCTHLKQGQIQDFMKGGSFTIVCARKFSPTTPTFVSHTHV